MTSRYDKKTGGKKKPIPLDENSTDNKSIVSALNNLIGTVEMLKESIDNGLSDVKLQVQTLDTRVTSTESSHKLLQQEVRDIAEYEERKNNLMIDGIPYTEEEEVYDYFTTLLGILKIKPEPSVTVTRFAGKDDEKRPIQIRFDLISQKEHFLEMYFGLKKKPTLNQFDFDSEERVYVRQDLPSNCNRIKAIANRLKKAGIIAKAGNFKHQVKVKPPNSKFWIHIPTVDSFERCLKSNGVPLPATFGQIMKKKK